MPELYENRELSWLKFNLRVLEEALDESTPLLERLRFVSIFASNLDEFYMVRVGSLLDQSLVGEQKPDNKSGMLPSEQIDAVNTAVRELYPRRDKAYFEIMKRLSGITYSQLSFKQLDGGEKRIAKEYFENELLPILSTQIIDLRHPFPHLENRALYIGVRIKSKNGGLFGTITLPHNSPKIFCMPGRQGFLTIEDIVLRYADIAFGVYDIEAKAIFRVTRNADIEIQENLFDEDSDYRALMSEILKKRRKLSPVRLEANHYSDPELTDFFISKLGLKPEQCFALESPLDLGFIERLEELAKPGLRERLLYAPFKSQWPAALSRGDILGQIKNKDVLLCYPYESMRPFVDLIRQAGEDPKVVSIQMTLYRIGQQSQIVQELCAAAENGKDVTVVVELRARFDEQSNINWSKVLESSGCRVVYGIDDYKLHGKVLLITVVSGKRREYLTNISTGNYNEMTAKLYTDLSLLTMNREIGEDAVEFFRNVNIGNIEGHYTHLLVSPSTFKSGLISLFDAEIQKAAVGGHACVAAKMNSLTDKDLIDKIICASQAGVHIRLLVRGICCLRPGVEGFTENVEVHSIVGRFLEHSRIYVFGEGENLRLYISSADLMTRNTERRMEVAVPVLDRNIAARIMEMFELQFKDNVKTRILGSDGVYTRPENTSERIDSQILFCREAVLRAGEAAARETQQSKKDRKGVFHILGSILRKRLDHKDRE